MKIILFLIGITTLFNKIILSQNLVVNNSFENIYNIPTSPTNINGGSLIYQVFTDWYRMTNFSPFTYNKINTCYPSTPLTPFITTCSVPYHGGSDELSFQQPRTGLGYISFYMAKNKGPNFGPIGCNSTQGLLKEKLIQNKVYCAGYYMSLHNWSQYLCNGYGMAFTEERIDTGTNANPPYYVHLDFLDYKMKAPIDLMISDSANWVQVADTFSTANGNENYLVISNYLASNEIEFSATGFDPYVWGGALYYLDDVFVYERKPVWVYGGDVSVCDTVTYVLKAEQAPEFVWWEISQPGVWLSTRDTLALPPGVGGTYVVRGEACGYVTYDTVTVTRLNCGLSMPGTVKDELLLSIYPNPASASFTLQLTAPGHVGGTLHISDMNGRRLASHLITQANSSISTEALAPGIYALAYERPGKLTWRGKLCVAR